MPQVNFITAFRYSTSQEAYDKINAYFLNEGGNILSDIVSGQVVSYDTMIYIDEGVVNPDFDFGNTFGYRAQKWNSLVNNYIDGDALEDLKDRIKARQSKNNKHYNESMRFSNNHNHGKNCLLSLTITQRANEPRPILSFTLRSSEITKRLLMDLLLVQRIGEEMFDIPCKFQVQVINMYQDVEAFCMLDSYKSIKGMILRAKGHKKTPYQKKVLKVLKKFKTIDIDKVKYKVHKRCVRQLQRPEGIPLSGDRPMYAKDLKL